MSLSCLTWKHLDDNSLTSFHRRYVHQPDPTEEVKEEEENGSEENDEDEIYKNQTNGLSGGKMFTVTLWYSWYYIACI